MKILVIGGSYFLGRWFVQYAQKENEVTVINRGNVPIGLDTVKELVADRHDVTSLMQYKDMEYDCIVDFCAYDKDDIKTVADIFGKEGKRYIFISTVDVYKKHTGKIINEESPIEDPELPGPEGAYISGKVKLEHELESVCKEKKMEYVSVRPSILYGPANYAPRERIYFDWIKNAGKIILPVENAGRFQLMYVEEAANVILHICKLKSVKRAYNVCPKEITDYEIFAAALHEAIKIDFEEIKMPTERILSENVPLPFPLTKEESEEYDGSRIEAFGLKKIPLSLGLKIAFESM